jgi:hypothetical protein
LGKVGSAICGSGELAGLHGSSSVHYFCMAFTTSESQAGRKFTAMIACLFAVNISVQFPQLAWKKTASIECSVVQNLECFVAQKASVSRAASGAAACCNLGHKRGRSPTEYYTVLYEQYALLYDGNVLASISRSLHSSVRSGFRCRAAVTTQQPNESVHNRDDLPPIE